MKQLAHDGDGSDEGLLATSDEALVESTDMGIVRLMMLGSINTKILATAPNEAVLRAAISIRGPRYFMNRMKVKSAPPSRACESTSLQI